MIEPRWIAADWGTSRLRLWAMGDGGVVIDHRASDDGMGGLSADGFESALSSLLDEWMARPVPVVACGMVGARQGWIEAPYAPCPGPPLAGPLTRAPARSGLDVRIVPGMAQDDPADVMRGEETQVAGLLARESGFEGTVCLPGTHTKWVRVAAGRVTGFTSCMTGEVFALLAERSILRHSLGAGAVSPDAFARHVEEGLAGGADLLARLFSLRAADLLRGADPMEARARLSALLIGAEVAAMADAREVALVGDPALASLYMLAVERAGGRVRRLDATELTLAGLAAAYEEHVA